MEAAIATRVPAITEVLFFILDPFNPKRLTEISFIFFVHYVVIEPDTCLNRIRLTLVRPRRQPVINVVCKYLSAVAYVFVEGSERVSGQSVIRKYSPLYPPHSTFRSPKIHFKSFCYVMNDLREPPNTLGA